MTNLGTAVLELKTDATKLNQGVEQAEKKASGLGNTLGSVGKIAGGFLVANVVGQGFAAFTSGVEQATDAAINLNESQNAVNQVFGDSAQTILDWGKQNANSFGLSQRAFNQMATPMGAMLKNAGLSMDDVTGSTIDLTKRAADMASVFNTDVDEALAAIQAGLRGEADPLERFGVGLSAAKVQAKALEMTGKELTSELTSEELALARVNLIMDQTNDVAGDFAATSDQNANAARIQAARQEELAAQIGQHLLPIQLKWTEAKAAFVELLATKVIPAVEVFAKQHLPAVKQAIQDVVAFIEEYWPKIQPIFEFAVKHVKTQIEGMIQTVKGIVQVVEGVVNLIDALIHGEWSRAWESAKQIMEGILNIIEGTIKRVFGAIPGLVMDGLSQLPGLAQQFIGQLPGIAEGFLNTMIGHFTNAFNSIPGIVGSAASAVIGEASRVGAAIVNGIASGIGSAAGAALDAAVGLGNDIINAIKSALRNFTISGSIGSVDLGPLGSTPSVSVNIRPFSFLANGVRNFLGGLAIVGERGPELVELPRGANVFSNRESREMANGSPTFVFNIENLSGIDEREARDIASLLGWETMAAYRLRGVATG